MPGPQRESNHTSTGYCRKPAGPHICGPYKAAKNKKPLTSNEISGFWQG